MAWIPIYSLNFSVLLEGLPNALDARNQNIRIKK